MIGHLSDIRKVQTAIGSGYPAFLFVSMVGLRGKAVYHIPESIWNIDEDSKPTDIQRDPLMFTDVAIDNDTVTLEVLLTPVFDQLWRASGWPGSPSNPAGKDGQ